MICFNWLHLTDLHRGMKEHQWLWPGVREIFFNDLQVLHEKCGPWDLVLFTGDLTQCGSLEEFHKVNNLFEQLWEYFDRLGSNPRLVVIPGNHDLVRPQKKTAAIRMLIQWNDYPDIQDEFWENEDSEYRQVVTQAFEPYTAWWNRQPFRAENINPGILPGDCSVTFEKEGVTLGIVGLNTSFLQLTEGNYDDKLALHTRQFHAVCGGDGLTWVKQHHTCLLLTHHPPVWLNSNSRQHLDGEIVAHGRFAVHLCGHMHETAYREIAEGGTEARRIWQGRSLFGLEYFGKENEDQRFHGYTAGRIELSENTGSLLFWPREARLQGRQRNIIPDHSILLTDNQHTHPKKFELLQPYIKGKPSTEQAEEQEKSLPFVIFAMTRKEAVDLFLPRSSMASKDEQAHYRRLKEILKDYNLENITRFYGETRENWCPPIAEEGETIQNAVENIVQQVNYRLGRDIPKIRPIFLSKEFLSDKKKEDRQIRRQLNKNGYILVIDAISMFHPLLSKKLKKSLHLIGRVSIILVSPESPINILLEELIIKNLDLDLILDYSENDFDIHYELDVVNMRSLKRRLFSVLPEAVRRIQNLTPPSPELRAEIRKEIQQQTGLTIGGIEQSFFKYKE